jgi:hypothetical protein
MWSASMVSCVFFTIIIVITPASAQRAVTRVKQVAEFTGPSNDIGEFGYSVAINGNLAVVGAPFANYAYLYIKGQAGWSQAARFDDGTNMNGFGWATAASSNVIAVGNPQLRNGGGTVFVFVKPEGGWVSMPATAQLTVPGMQMGLGGSLAISPDGKTIVAGAPAANGMQGETCVFVEPAGGWINVTEATATLTASSSVVSGNSVAMSGNTIVVGNDDPNLGSEVYIFVKPTDGWVSTSQPNAVLTASDETQSDNFGYSVAIDGNTVVVGAPLHPNVGAGTAYVFVKPSGGWQNMTQTAELSINVNHPIGLGVSVAVEGNVILAGAPDDAIGHNNQQGAVFGYIEPARGWQNTTTTNGSVTAQNGQAKELFGSRLALSGKTFIVGAPDYNGLVGAAYIFQAQ